VRRFINKVYRLVKGFIKDQANSPVGSLSNLNDIQTDVRLKTHQTLRKITDDMERRHLFNTVQVMTQMWCNWAERFK
jgi:leucyl-tRNA synthetase